MSLLSLIISGTLGAAVFLLLLGISRRKEPFLARGPGRNHGERKASIVPLPWIAMAALSVSMSIAFEQWTLAVASVLWVLFPILLQRRSQKRHLRNIYAQMDNTLASLANAASVSGSLYTALEDVAEGELEPMRSELQQVLHEIRLGKSEEEAFHHLAIRCPVPLFRTAITAVLVGKKSGGNLSAILSSTAAGIREIKRLEGVMRVKTSEARNQAWIMGMIPFFLCGILHLVNPQWLAPMWSTPFGWLLLMGCVMLELGAVFLIRKILSVTL